IRRQFEFRFEGFSNWTPFQLSKCTNLSLESAQRALQRYATEPILWGDTDANWSGFEDALTANELVVVQGGRFSHVMGATDKADGMTRVLDLYQACYKNSSFTTIAVGDSPNDIGMLERADIGVVIPNPYNTEPLELNRKKCVRALAPGPSGWNSAVSDVVHEFYQSIN
ncbi:MAG: HAD hydrolase family protein, partial [Mariniblastus sp.]|nr:HAD hydrolase family protein [Mariniblastus sp.]